MEIEEREPEEEHVHPLERTEEEVENDETEDDTSDDNDSED